MRDFASCFNEYAVHVSDSYTCASNSGNSCISPVLTPSVQNRVLCIYRAILSNKKNIPIRVSWCRTAASHCLTVNFGDDPSAAAFKLSSNTRLFRKKKGSKTLELFDNSKVEIFWDLSAARYGGAGPEPIDGYYVLVTIDSELSLILGDMAGESTTMRKIKTGIVHTAKCKLISRQEHFAGNALFSTKAQFCETGTSHDVVLSVFGENEAAKHPVLSVSIDKKVVIRVKRLQWNFRGNHTIFVDGLLVDLMWDVHDWFYSPGPGSGLAVFMFRTRSGMDSRLWLEEKLQPKKDDDKVDFSFLIYANRST